MAIEKYSQARKYLTHAFEVEPNSTSGREALLLVADSLYKQGGTQNLVQAEAKYRDFLNRFPTSERAAYVQLQIGNSLAARVERPDRDQSVTRQAVAALEDLLRLYPTSEHAAEAKQRLAEVRAKLGEHEFEVARFYYRYGIPVATANRLNFLLANYPEFAEKDMSITTWASPSSAWASPCSRSAGTPDAACRTTGRPPRASPCA